MKGLLTLATKDGGYGLDANKDKSYISYVLNAIAPESVKGFKDVYDLKEYQNNLAEAFKASQVPNDAMKVMCNSILQLIKQAKEIELIFKPADKLPKISGILEKALFAANAKLGTTGQVYGTRDYFYWIERGLTHPELLKELALENKSLSQPALDEGQAKKILRTYFEIATVQDEGEKNKKLSQLISGGYKAELLFEKFKLIDTAMGAKYRDYLSQNSSYNEETYQPLSRLAIFEDLRKSSSQQLCSFIDKEIKLSANPSPFSQVSDESINLYKELFTSANTTWDKSYAMEEFLLQPLIKSSNEITDDAIKASSSRIDKLIEDFTILDSVLIPNLKDKYPHLKDLVKPLLDARSSSWKGGEVSVKESLGSYKDLNLLGLLERGKKMLLETFKLEPLDFAPRPDSRYFKTEAEKEELLKYIESFNGISKAVDIQSQEFTARVKNAFLNSGDQDAVALNSAIDLAYERVNFMQAKFFNKDSLLYEMLHSTLYHLIEPFVNVSPEDQDSLKRLKASLKTDNSAANFLNLINLNKEELIQLGVKPEQASPENLARYIRYQESPDHSALKLDMQERYKSLTEGSKPASHTQAITQIHKEFQEFLRAYDDSQLADRLEAVGKKLKSTAGNNTEVINSRDFTRLSELSIMSDFPSELGAVNPTNMLNKQRIDNFIYLYSHRLDDGSLMLGLPKKSLEKEREYIHLNAEDSKHFSDVMANYLLANINLNQINIRRDDLIVHPSVPDTGRLLNSGLTENSSSILFETNHGLVTKPQFKFQGMSFVEEGGLLLPKGLTETGSVTTQEPRTLVSKDSISLTQNAFKIYTLASGAGTSKLEYFTPTSDIVHNLNLGDYAREALLELNAKQSQGKEEKALITETFKSLQGASPEELNARFVDYESKNGTLRDSYKNPAYNNLFLESLEKNQVSPAQAAEYLTKTLDKTISNHNLVNSKKTKFIEGIEKMFKVFEAVYLEIFSNTKTSSGANLGEGKIKPLMENQEVQAYFKKNATAGVLKI